MFSSASTRGRRRRPLRLIYWIAWNIRHEISDLPNLMMDWLEILAQHCQCVLRCIRLVVMKLFIFIVIYLYFYPQDPPNIPLYVAMKTVNLNGVELTKFRCRRGSNTLEGLHAHLLLMPSHQIVVPSCPFRWIWKLLRFTETCLTHSGLVWAELGLWRTCVIPKSNTNFKTIPLASGPEEDWVQDSYPSFQSIA